MLQIVQFLFTECSMQDWSLYALYGRDIANFWEVQSPYKRDTEWHNERFHGSTSIVLQEAPQLTTPSVFSSNDQPSTPHSPTAIPQLRCHRHPRWPYYRQQAPCPTFCARPTIRRISSLALPLPAQFWPSGDLLSQTILARSFLRETTVPLFFERLQHSLTFGRLPSQPSDFSLSVYFCYVPTVVYRYSLLWERIVFCFRVVSVSMWYLLLHVFIW